AALKPVVFGPQPANCGFVLPLLVGVAGAQGVTYPSQDFLVESQPSEQFREPLPDDLLAHVGFIAPALVSRAMVIDVTLLLDLADNRTPAVTAGDQPRKGEIVFHAAMLLGVPAVQNNLNAFEQVAGDQWLVFPLVHTPIPLELAHIEPIAQRGVDRAHRHW